SWMAPIVPSAPTVDWMLLSTSRLTAGSSVTCWPIVATRTNAWVATKAKKTGASTEIDSLTPRKLSTTSSTRIEVSKTSLNEAHAAGMKLNSASAPDETDTVIVKM